MIFEALVDLVPQPFWNMSGKVFYTGREGFSNRAEVYVLGYNPGGDPDRQADETLRANVEMLQERDSPWSAYCDEEWHGQAEKYRRSAVHVVRALGLDIRATPASNLIFLRSRRAEYLQLKPTQVIDHCWPFHKAVVKELRPKLILCLGFETGEEVANRLGVSENVARVSPYLRVSRHWDGPIIAAGHHPSYRPWYKPEYDPSAGLLDLLGRT
jgi:hypothetical protein